MQVLVPGRCPAACSGMQRGGMPVAPRQPHHAHQHQQHHLAAGVAGRACGHAAKAAAPRAHGSSRHHPLQQQQQQHHSVVARAADVDAAAAASSDLQEALAFAAAAGGGKKLKKPKKPTKGPKGGGGSSSSNGGGSSSSSSGGSSSTTSSNGGSAMATAEEQQQASAGSTASAAALGASVEATFEEPDPVPAGVVVGESDDDDGERRQSGSSGISSGLRLENISMTFKNQQVLRDVSWEVKKGERVGLVGVNGAGKTTQLQIVMGRLQPDGGEIIKAKRHMKIAYLAQEFDVNPSRTVREEFSSVYASQLALVAEQERLSRELEGCGEDMARMQSLLDRLDKLNARALTLDVTTLDKRIDQMMPELGFTPADNDRLVASFSGGWQMRMCLGKLLLQEPDVLLLDEPTNHLDLDAIEWLERYLKQQDVPMVIVSHDREFLDNLCTKIVETERCVATTYKGNYSAYVASKAEREALQWAAYDKQQKEIDKLQDMVRRLSGGAQSGRAAAAEKQIEKIKAEGLVEKPFVPKRRSFTFPPVEKMGQKVVEVAGLSHGYAGRPLFRDASLEIEQGERVAIIGPNGAGKSTLLRLIMGKEKPNKGLVRLGEHNIVANYFEQNQAEALDPQLSVLDTLVRAAPDAKLNDLKQLLGRMLFSGSAMDKKVKVLSGGEKARLALAKFMCTKGTLLILDEPTNHLDIPSKETLEEAVRAFQGAVIAVSHDRYFLKRIATRVLLAEDCQLKDFGGDYEYYLSKHEAEAVKMEAKFARAAAIEKSQTKAKSKMSKAEKERARKEKGKAFNEAAAGKGMQKRR